MKVESIAECSLGLSDNWSRKTICGLFESGCFTQVLLYIHFKVLFLLQRQLRERSGSVVECLTRDRRAVGSSLTSVTALCP